MIIPMLPDYLTSLGGGEYKGLIIALFTITAGLSRPFSGKLADKIGRLPVMIFGAVVCFVAGLAYPFCNGGHCFFCFTFIAWFFYRLYAYWECRLCSRYSAGQSKR